MVFPLMMLFVAARAAFRGDWWIGGAFACAAVLGFWIVLRAHRR
jgi:hypothetical protein